MQHSDRHTYLPLPNKLSPLCSQLETLESSVSRGVVADLKGCQHTFVGADADTLRQVRKGLRILRIMRGDIDQECTLSYVPLTVRITVLGLHFDEIPKPIHRGANLHGRFHISPTGKTSTDSRSTPTHHDIIKPKYNNTLSWY